MHAAKLGQQTPCSDGSGHAQHIAAINADANVNAHNIFIVVTYAVTKMEGQAVFSYSHKRANALKTLPSTRAVTFDKE